MDETSESAAHLTPSIPVPSAGLLPRRDNSKLAMWVFLGGEVVFFGLLIAIYWMVRLRAAAEFAAARAHMSIPLISLNTFILILSSYMVVRALESVQAGNRKAMRTNLILVMVLGALFLGGQAFEWITLRSEGIWFNTVFGTPFFTITGIHGTHVLLGIIWAGFLQFILHSGGITQKDHRSLENFGLYWHFVDIVWIVLFTLFYLI